MSPSRTALVLTAVGVVAAVARVALLMRSGPLGVGSYDDGVHYAVAVGLVHGRLPYRDLRFLQPPGVPLLVAPFAALAPWLGDPGAFVAAKLAFALLGGGNAMLTAAVLRRSGTGAALTGGLLYALASPLVYTERTVVLETPGWTGVLVALLLLREPGRGSPRILVAGLAAGLAIACKGWYAVPFLVLLAAARGGRVRFLVGGAIGAAAVLLPFFVLAPGAMWEQVVLAQLGRPRLGDQPLLARLTSILGITGIAGPTALPGVGREVLLPVLGAVAIACCGVAALRRDGRVLVALVLSGLAVLLGSPSYYLHYAVLVDAPLALVGGTAVGVLVHRLPTPALARAAIAGAVVVTVGLTAHQDLGTVRLRTPPVALVRAAQEVPGCVVSDDPGLLAVLGTLTRDVAAGCPLQADPSGVSYTTARFTIDGVAVDRDRNPRFQRAIVRYLLSGAAFVVVRNGALLLQPPALEALEARPVIASGDGFVLRRSR